MATPTGYAMNTNAAAQQCSAAVQTRLNNRVSMGEIIGAALGVNSARVACSASRRSTQTAIRSESAVSRPAAVRVNGYGAYGVGAYGALGYNGYAPDLSFRCDVDYRGYVRDVEHHSPLAGAANRRRGAPGRPRRSFLCGNRVT